jgi:DNA mismatch endonuclease, patch repair protein
MTRTRSRHRKDPLPKLEINLDKQLHSQKQSGFGTITRSTLMSRVRSRGNKSTEGKMVELLRRHGITGWRRHVRMIGNPDFIWKRARMALFIDGCFWHGHHCGRNLTPKTNSDYWERKIMKNRIRDREVRRALRKAEWTVVRIWECALSQSPEGCARRVQAAL